MRGSILRRFTITTLVALAVASAASFAVSYDYTMREALNAGSTYTTTAADVTRLYLKSVNADSMPDPNSSVYQKAREGLRQICGYYKLTYISIYTLDEALSNRTYYYAVGSDEEDDELMRKHFPYGTTSDVPLSRYEIEAFKGNDTEEPPERIDNEYGFTFAWFYPFYVSSTNEHYVICTEINMLKTAAAVNDNTLSFAVPMVFILTLVILAQVLLIRRNVIKPLRLVSSRMRGFITDRARVDEPLNVGNDDEISEIAESFNQMSTDIELYMDRIEEMTEDRVAASTELQVARRIQMGLVPQTSNERGPGFEAFALCRAAREVGGDFYDLFVREDGRVCLVMADVSGKGVSAALFMSMCHTLIHEKLHIGMGPAQTLNEANESILQNNPEGLFVTVFAGVYNPATQMLRYANAGHTRPYIIGRGYLNPDPGIALGLFEDADIVEERTELSPGEGILLYTDGANEAVNADDAFFGEERLARTVCKANNARAAVQSLADSVDDFAAGREQFDDLTLLCLFAQQGNMWHWTLSPQLSSFATLRHGILELCGNTVAVRRALLALDEAFSNVVNYSGASSIDAWASLEDEVLSTRLVDDGIAFNPLEHEEDDKEFEDFEAGGMGISFMREVSDELSYERDNDCNCLYMTFKLSTE